ncbi:MAG TPA: serine/threonine-protein kinase [Bacteroidota bacterium]|jgi:serine/threonine protein kinase/Flp pilus assembly protein TadD
MIGQTISHYKILEKLGEGGMGVVYKAEDVNLRRTVVLKFLTRHAKDDPRSTPRFALEARAAARIQHPNVAAVYEYAEASEPSGEGSQSFIAMEYVEGETLKARIGRGPLPVAEALRVFQQLLHGLQAAHAKGIVHRDIKPANVILMRDGTVKILDFGVSKLSGEPTITATNAVVGSIAYMSPEQLSGGTVDQRCDIWAAGIVLGEMLAQQLPFPGDYSEAIMYKILHEPPLDLRTVRGDIPDLCQAVYLRCLEKNAAQRFQSADEVLNALGATSPGPSRKRVALTQKRRVQLVLAILLVAAGALWRFVQNNPDGSHGRPGALRVGIVPYRNLAVPNDPNQWAYALQGLLVQRLTGTGGLGIIDPMSLNGLIESSFGGSNSQHTTGQLFDAARSVGLSDIIDGTISLVSGSGAKPYVIHTQVVEASSRSVVYSTDAAFSGEPDMAAAADSIASGIRSYFQVHQLEAGRETELNVWYQHGVRNVEALKAFLQASRYIFRIEPGGEPYLRRAIALDSEFVSPRIWLVSTLVGHRKVDEARQEIAVLKRLEPSASPFDQAMIGWAEAYASGDLAGQIRALQHALEFSPDNNILLFNLAIDHYILKNYDAAIADLKPVMQMRWQYSAAYYLLAGCYESLHDLKRAREVLESSLSIKPVYKGNYGLLAAVTTRLGDTVNALKYEVSYLQRCAELGDSAAEGFAGLAKMYADDELFGKGEEFYRQAIALKLNDPSYHRHLADCLSKLGKVDSAKDEYRAALKLNPGLSEIYPILGKLYEQSGDTQTALKFFKQFRAKDSLSDQAKR